jgi:hypothetical protein
MAGRGSVGEVSRYGGKAMSDSRSCISRVMVVVLILAVLLAVVGLRAPVAFAPSA